MKIEEGMYVRTDLGEIAKIISSSHYKNETGDYNYLHDDNNLRYGIYDDLPNSHVIKASYNIIDLIEFGDYVNGSPVCMTKLDEHGRAWVYTDSNYKVGILESEIKSIATKEQMENISYKVK